MYLAFLIVVTVILWIWLVTCGVAFIIMCVEEEWPYIVAWGIALVITLLSTAMTTACLATEVTLDNQRGLICFEHGGEWMISKCYKNGQEVELEEGND